MSNVPIKDADDVTRKIDVFTRTEGADTLESQAVVVIDPTNGNALKPNADGSFTLSPAQVAALTPPAAITGFATQTTLAALKTTADSIQAAATAIELAVESLDTKTTTVNTGAIAGSVSVSNHPANPATSTLQTAGNSSLTSIDNKLPALSGGRVPVELPAGGSGLTDSELRATPVPVSQTNAAQETGGNLAAISLDLGAPADSAATTDTGTWSITALIKRLFSRLPLLWTTIPVNNASGVPVRTIGQDIWNVSFSEVGASVISPQFTTPVVGTGVSFNQASGALNIVAGTTANAEFFTRSTQAWQGSLRLRFATVLSQRIANNNFAVLLADLRGEGLAVTINSATSITVAQAGHTFTAQNVGQFVNVAKIVGAAGVPGRYAIASVVPNVSFNLTVAGWPASGSCTATVFGHSYVRNLFTGTTATNVNFDAQRRGWAAGDTVATINTTASPGTIIVNELAGRECYLLDQLRASTTTPTLATRASRLENLPDDNLDLYVFVWSFNGTSAPASSTTYTLSFCSVEKFANTPVYVQGARSNGAINPIPVAQQGTATVSGTVTATVSGTVTANIGTGSIAAGTNAIGDVGIQYRANATGAASVSSVIAAATTNATVVKASAGRLLGWQLQNTTASLVYVKMHNQTTTPTAGASVAFAIPIPANGKSEITVGGGLAFTTGIGFTTVTGSANTDATAVTAGAIVGTLHFS